MAISSGDVNNVIDHSLSDVSTQVTQAQTLIDDELPNVDTDRQDLVGTYVAAHFVAIRDPHIRREQGLDQSRTYEGQHGMNFEFTRWGQQAVALDPTGNLKALSQGKKRNHSITIATKEGVK